MKGRCPQTIITDLDPGLRDAIRRELPSTRHVISVYNILPKLSGWFSLSLGPQFAEFKSEFDALCHVENTEDFELRWSQMVSMFGLGSDKHIALLYAIRTSWASSYTRGYFLAQMTTTTYSKSVDAFLKGIFTAQTCLRSFFEQVYQPHLLSHIASTDFDGLIVYSSIWNSCRLVSLPIYKTSHVMKCSICI